MPISACTSVKVGAFCPWRVTASQNMCTKFLMHLCVITPQPEPSVRTRGTEVQQSCVIATHSSSSNGDASSSPQRCHLLWACSEGWEWWKAKQRPRASLWTPPRGRQSTALSASRLKVRNRTRTAAELQSASWQSPLKTLREVNLSLFLKKELAQTAPVSRY